MSKPAAVRELQPSYRLHYAGPAALSTPDLLEVLIGGKDAHDLARTLIGEQGLGGLYQMGASELTQYPGIGEVTAARIRASLELGRRLLLSATPPQMQIRTPADVANLFMVDMKYLDHEELRVVLLDTKNRIHKIVTVYVGNLNTAIVRVGEVFKEAVRVNAAAIIVVHNHPSSDPTPSPEDVRVTQKIVQAGELLNIDVLDHLVIGDNRYVSLKERGLI